MMGDKIFHALQEYFLNSAPNLHTIPIAITIASTTLIILGLSLYLKIKSNPIYLVDFTCYKPRDSLRVPEAHFIEHTETSDVFNQESKDFQAKLLLRSGIGPESCMPVKTHQIPPDTSLVASTDEIEEVLFTTVAELLSKTNTNPETIDILVTNCSLYCPTPSISSLVAKRFGFRDDVKGFSLSGMGCSAGLLAVSLAKDMLRVHPNSTALVLSMESVSANGYKGKIKSMLMANVLFRMGGAAILLSNKAHHAAVAKYELRHLVRTHVGADDKAYRSVFQEADEDGWVGVSISRSLLGVASKALRINMLELGPLALPYSEMLRYVASATWRALVLRDDNPKDTSAMYVPNFKRAFEHFCIHAGGRAVIEGLEEKLNLERVDTEASRMTLYRFGNTSSSSVWYELCYLEAKNKINKGDRVWQIAFGSGFKCNSAVWRRVNDHRNVVKQVNAWSDRVNRYPVET